MITFLSSPKPFVGVAKENQYRAIRSWQAATQGSEIMLYGNSGGIEEAGRDLGVTIIKDVACATSGIPYFGAITEHATRHAKHDLQIYVNCDILLSDMAPPMTRVPFDQFLLVGQRIDLSEGCSVDLTVSNWRQDLKSLAHKDKVSVHRPGGKDYFGFRRGLWQDLPPVVIGRAGYDNVLMVHCMRKRVPIVDGTFSVLALHQFHDYSHNVEGVKTTFASEDAVSNTQLAGGRHSSMLTCDAQYVLQGETVLRWPCRGDWLRYLELLVRFQYGWPTAGLALRVLWRGLRAIGLTRIPESSLEEVMEAFQKSKR